MQNETIISRIVYFLNKILAVLTIAAYILPFLTPKLFPFLSVLTLFLPLFLILNFMFFTVWALQLKKKALLSGVILLIGSPFINKFYKYTETNIAPEPSDFTLMSYNVRLFNLYEWLPEKDIPEQITDVLQGYNPDILCLQEYSPNERVRLRNFPYKSVKVHGGKNKYGQAIFSKYEIINDGEIDFPNSANNVIFADIVRNTDTIRVYSMHLQSIKISNDIHEKIDENKSKMIFKRIGEAFSKQQHQAEQLREHYKKCKYPKIICGDLNNSAFSYVYRTVKGGMRDAFEEAGTGFGTSYNFNIYPARIDYVFTEKSIKVKEFKTNEKFVLSDHFLLWTRLELQK